jgi:tagatose 6-phosphate kinase
MSQNNHLATVTLNAAIDKTYFMDEFPLGKVSRVRELRSFPGGKGVNVARVAHLLGESVTATGFAAGFNGSALTAGLDGQGIPHDFVRIEGESRLCLSMIDKNGTITELLEPGPIVQSDDLARMNAKVKELAARSSIVSFSGSPVQGAPADVYTGLIETAKREGARVLLDTSGAALSEGIKAKPWLIKPNEHEVAQLAGGQTPASEEELGAVIRSVMERGIACVIVSLGAEGSLAGWEGQLYRVRAPRIEPVNTVGCGDAFLAGVAAGLLRGYEPVECLRLATASGTANALMQEAGNIRQEDVERFRSQVQIESVV